MSKTAYVVRHIHFENAGILEPLLIERGFTLEYIEAPLADFNQYDATKADLVVVCGAPIGAYDEEIYPFLTDEIKFIRIASIVKNHYSASVLGRNLFPASWAAMWAL